MVKKFRRLKPRRSSSHMGITPHVYFTEQAVEDLNDFRFNLKKREKRGRELAMLELAGIMVEAVQRLAPKEVGGVKEYAKKLQIAFVKGDEGDTVAIILPEVKRELTEEDNEDTVVYIETKDYSPKSVKVLQSYQPWPVALLPFQPSGRGVRVISRQVSRSEIARLSARILSKRASIESALKRVGVRGAKVEEGKRAAGTEVADDLAFSVLRREFGIADKSEPHWRPAIKAVQSQLKQLGEKLVKYVMTGKESVFSLPPHVTVSASEVMAFEPFQTKIASAAGLK